jgi:hypothetical protein
MNARCKVGAVLATATLLAACGGGGGDGGSSSNQASKDIAVPGIDASSTFSFDLGTVVNGKYYVTDRNNKAVDVIDLATFQLTRIVGTGANAFSGCVPTANCVGANNGRSGPDGINAIPGTSLLLVGDVDTVRVVDTTAGTVVKSIRVGATGFRADEGCVDPDHNLYMISSPDASPPFASFIDTRTQTLLATVRWIDPAGGPAGGNEQCQYDAATQSFLVNNDSTSANPNGEVDVIPAASILALAPGATVDAFTLPGIKRFPLGNCDPTGMDLGPGREMVVECRQGTAGSKLTTLILNRDNGAILATVPVGGGDQVAYDARTNRYYVAASRWHTSGVNEEGGGCTATNLCAPLLAVIDAASHAIVLTTPSGNNAHSVAVDPVNGWVLVPYSPAASPAGCATCVDSGFINGGVLVYKFG